MQYEWKLTHRTYETQKLHTTKETVETAWRIGENPLLATYLTRNGFLDSTKN